MVKRINRPKEGLRTLDTEEVQVAVEQWIVGYRIAEREYGSGEGRDIGREVAKNLLRNPGHYGALTTEQLIWLIQENAGVPIPDVVFQAREQCVREFCRLATVCLQSESEAMLEVQNSTLYGAVAAD